MKRLVIIGLFLLCGTVWAQTTDSASVGRVLGDESPIKRSRELNVLGAPVYYDTLGNVIGQSASADSFYHRPKHHYHNRLENDFCAFFLEGETLLTRDNVAFGGQVAWMPRRWGVYASGLVGGRHGYLSAGPVLRLSDCGNWIDWHLYGGLSVSRTLGAELGVRMASPKLWGDFCWTSFSFTMGHVNGYNYVTLGLSLTLTSLVAITIW